MMESHVYDYGDVKWGQFPYEWGAGALHAHIADPNVTPDGKGRAAAELERRREERTLWRQLVG